MAHLTRRHALGLAAGSAGTLILPRFAIGQADNRPSITIAVQKIANSNTLETLREQSNVGTRTFYSYVETLIDTDWGGDLSLRPGLASAWRRIDDRTVELTLREGVKFHNGETMTAEDVAFSFGNERMWGGAAQAGSAGLFGSVTAGQASKQPPAEVVSIAKPRLSQLREDRDRRRAHGALRQQDAGRDAGRPHLAQCRRHRLAQGVFGSRDLARLGAQADRHRPLQDRRVQAGSVADLARP